MLYLEDEKYFAVLDPMGPEDESAVIGKADFEDNVAYLTENEFGHPALFPAWKKKQKTIA